MSSNRSQTLYASGFTELQAALLRVEGKGNFGLEYELQRRLRVIGEGVAKAAPHYVTHKHPAAHEGERLEDSVKVSVTLRQVSVFSRSIYGGAQNFGAWIHEPGKRGMTGVHIQRGNASKWMLKAVASQQPVIQAEMDGLAEWVAREIDP